MAKPTKPAVAVENGCQRAVGRIPVASSEMPAAGMKKSKRSKGDGNSIDIGRLEPGVLKAEPRRLASLPPLGVFVPDQPLLLNCGDNSPIDDQRRRRVVTDASSHSQDVHFKTNTIDWLMARMSLNANSLL